LNESGNIYLMLILFFDTYIVSGYGSESGSSNDQRRGTLLANFRDSLNTYKWQEKIDVVKYTLASYSKISWDKVIIRFECEDIGEVLGFAGYCQKLFPTAKVINERSATAAQYTSAFNTIDAPDDAWVFFSPNNDHPYLAEPEDLIQFVLSADKILENYPNHTVSLVYSHFTESMNDNLVTDPKWGYYYNIFKRVIYEDKKIIVTKSNGTVNDSIKLYKLSQLKNFFSETKNKGRVIRIEDTEFYFSKDDKTIVITPKTELCRHYDSYSHIGIPMNSVPPLFIPNGFFEKNIKIRYGYNNAIDGWININPLKKIIDSNTDLLILLEDIPSFWKDRISAVDVNHKFPKGLARKDLIYYRNIRNPWASRPTVYNIIRSMWAFLLAYRSKALSAMLTRLGVFERIQTFKNSF
jgi:hypothetical protein